MGSAYTPTVPLLRAVYATCVMPSTFVLEKQGDILTTYNDFLWSP